MSFQRPFPFGKAPVPTPTPAQSTGPLPLLPPPPDPKATVPLSDFMPPDRVLPFRAPPPPTLPVSLVPPLPPPPALPASLVPPLPPRQMRRASVSYQNVVAVFLILIDLVVFAYAAATWGR